MIVEKERDERKDPPKFWAAHHAQELFILLVAITVLVAILIIFVYRPVNVSLEELKAQIIPSLWAHIAPEPVERFTFGILAVAIPIFAAVFAYKVPSLQGVVPGALIAGLLPIAVTLIMVLPFYRADFMSVIFGLYPKTDKVREFHLLGAFLLSVVFCWLITSSRSGLGVLPVAVRSSVAWMVFAIAVFLQLLSWRLVGLASVTGDGRWGTHADPIFYVLSQVIHGKTLLVDFPSQYGMYPELMAPVLHITGLSVASVVAIFALMQVGGMGALFFVMTRTIRSRALTAISGVALVLVTFETVLHLAGIEERYFQYWPIRFFWPAMSVLVFYWFLKGPTYARGLVMALVGAIAMLWNLDSGLFVEVAFGSYLLARAVIRPAGAAFSEKEAWSPAAYLWMAVLQVLIAAICVGSFFGYLMWKAGEALSFAWLFEYQRIFVGMGLMMLPLPTVAHPWMSVIGVYLAGMLVAFIGWRRGDGHFRLSMQFFLGMLGIGLFVYYIGRSHILNLVTVCWPAILLVAIFSDEILRAVRVKRLPKNQVVVAVAGCTVLVAMAMSFLERVPMLTRQVESQFSTRGHPVEPVVQSEILFIRRYSLVHSGCLILSARQGIYYAEAGFSSPLRGPGRVEVLLRSDEEALALQLLGEELPCIFFGVGPLSDVGLKVPRDILMKKYRIADVNDLKTMALLLPVQKGQGQGN